MTLIASDISAGKEAYLHADGDLQLLAAQDKDYTLYDMKKSGSWGSKKTQHDEVTQITHIGTQIKSGGDLTLSSGGDQRYQVAKLESGKDIILDSGGAIVFEGVKDLHDESHTKSDGDAFWTSSKGKGNTDETLRQTQMIAKGNITIKAVEGLRIDLKEVNQQTVSQTIDAMVQADPQLAWLKQAEARGDVDWRQVKEIHESFKYETSGLGPASQIIIAIVMAAIVGPAALSALSASMSTAWAAGLAAVASGAATNATTSFINNGGNLGAVFQDVTSSDALKGYVISGVTAGLTASFFKDILKITTSPTGKVTVDLSSLDGIGRFGVNQVLQGGTSALLGKALGEDVSVSDVLKTALFNTLAAASFNTVGDFTKGVADGSPTKVVIHAMVGGLLSEVTDGDFATGALAAGANEALIVDLNKLVGGNPDLLSMASQIVGVLAASTQGDVDADTLQTGAWVANNATQYNWLLHHETEQMLREIDEQTTEEGKAEVRERYANLDESRNKELPALCKRSSDFCDRLATRLLEDDPKLRDLAKQLSASGQYEKATVVAMLIVNSNVAAGSIIATELAALSEGESSRFKNALGATFLGAVNGITRPGGIGTKSVPLVSKGGDVTPEIIQKALLGDPAISAQNGVSLPAIQRYVDRLLAGDIAPPIKMDGNVIVDGNHRYIAAKILGMDPDVVPGALPPNKTDRIKPISDISIDPVDWGNK